MLDKEKGTKMKKRVIVSVAVLLAAATAFADDWFPPPWRGQDGSTFQEWRFLTPDLIPVPDVVINKYGQPLLEVNPAGQWLDSFNSALGVWPLSGEMDLYIPNRPLPLEQKDIWIQLTWMPGELSDPSLSDEPIVGIVPFDSMQMSRENFIDPNGWTHTTFIISIYPNPAREWINVKGNILVDQLVIDTICIPEPTTIVLLGLGALALLIKRRA